VGRAAGSCGRTGAGGGRGKNGRARGARILLAGREFIFI
jgi:hypothetical protein